MLKNFVKYLIGAILGLLAFGIVDRAAITVVSIALVLLLELFGIIVSENPTALGNVQAGTELLSLILGLWAFFKVYRRVVKPKKKTAKNGEVATVQT
jgi:hypothetical protein